MIPGSMPLLAGSRLGFGVSDRRFRFLLKADLNPNWSHLLKSKIKSGDFFFLKFVR